MSAATLYTLAGVPLHMDADNIQANWPVFVQMFLARGAHLGKFEHTGGLLASVLPDPEFLAWFAVLPDTVVPDNPGVLAAAADAHIHRDQLHRYRTYCSNLESLQMTFDAHIYPSLLLALRDPIVGLALTDLAGQFLHVRNVYGNLPSDYLDEFHSALDRAQTNDSVVTVLDRFLTYFGMQAAVHATLSEYDKIKMLHKAFNWGIYEGVLRRYLRDHEQIPRLPPQAGDQLYSELATALLHEEAMHRKTKLAEQHSLKSAHTSEPVLAVTPVALAATPVPAAPQPHKTGTGAHGFCWSHGTCEHASKPCKAPFPGHQVKATKSNPMGGATYTWFSLTPAQRKLVTEQGPSAYRA
jgi:hypothetical protein